MFHAFLQIDQNGSDQLHEPFESSFWIVLPGGREFFVFFVPFVRADSESVADLTANVFIERTAFSVRFR